jgi:hypothetical protein
MMPALLFLSSLALIASLLTLYVTRPSPRT